MSTKAILAILVTIAALGGAFIALKPGTTADEAPPPAAESVATATPATTTFSFLVSQGRVTPPENFRVTQGQEVTIRVTADAADDIHLHGYDLSTPTVPGQPAELKFVAATAGRFELELEKAGTSLGNLEVTPR